MRTLAGAALLAAFAPSVEAQDFSLGKPTLLGQVVLPTGLKIAGVEFGGISGLDYDAGSDLFYAISDDRSERAPARIYKLKLAIGEKGVASVDIVSSHQLTGADGKAFAANNIGPEAIRVDAASKRLFWSSEGDSADRPAIYEANLDGTFVKAFDLPEAYLPNADGTRGVRGNLAFESLSISADGKTLWAGTENALIQDGDKATLEAGSPSRIVGLDIATGAVAAEYVYETGKIFTKATQNPFLNDNGLSDLLAVSRDTLLTVERSFALGIGNEINFYLAKLTGATDVKGLASLNGQTVVPLIKQHLIKIGEGDFGLDIDNIEASTFGPEVAGKRTLVIASDNNFNADGQFTQFVAFVLEPVSKE
ncbi:esterase-like activity of phytase family protein [Mesorhizobium muleiense]|uniref:esterase-like activity of phytase family protein n=1 Tax=Mesorhizobium muleiense TaxID=1004279 RepID=UPI001F170B2F|nr:esterase-like activity of phytase family protein [Mesorhizobium muleiense]MCF6113414.1 esterase-like activity of phytase family protein [Mesorhizobium muleiense]